MTDDTKDFVNDPYHDPNTISGDRRLASVSRFPDTGEWEYTLKPGFTYKGLTTFRRPGHEDWSQIKPFILYNDPNGPDGPS